MAFDPDRTLVQMLPWTTEGAKWRAQQATRAAAAAQRAVDRRLLFSLERKIGRNELVAKKHSSLLESLAERGVPREQLRIQAGIMVACQLMVRRLRSLHAIVERREMNADLTQYVLDFKRSEEEHDRLLSAVTRELLLQPGIRASAMHDRQRTAVDMLLANALAQPAEQMAEVDPEEGDGALLDTLDSAAGVERSAAEAKESVQGAVDRAIDVALMSVEHKLPRTPLNTARAAREAPLVETEDAEFTALRKRFVKFRTPSDATAAEEPVVAAKPEPPVERVVVAQPVAAVTAERLDERLRELRREQDVRAMESATFSLDSDTEEAGAAE